MSASQIATQLENALGELVSWGLVSADSYAGLRALIEPATKARGRGRRRGRASAWSGCSSR